MLSICTNKLSEQSNSIRPLFIILGRQVSLLSEHNNFVRDPLSVKDGSSTKLLYEQFSSFIDDGKIGSSTKLLYEQFKYISVLLRGGKLASCLFIIYIFLHFLIMCDFSA
jgi:hypothetical protein